jgi:hypothetical protein
MNGQQLMTWTRLANLNFDAADAAFPFSARLARDNCWSRSFAEQAIEEYRKFCFLAAHAGHPVTPSDEVDQVWHLHLTYSQHYWDTLCRDTLERPLHHGPTEGGSAEDHKFHEWYEATLASYRRFFGEPPNELWPAARERFHERNDFVRINRRDVVTLNRKTLVRGALASLVGSGVLVGAHAVAQTEDSSQIFSEYTIFVLGIALIVTLLIGNAVKNRRRKLSNASRKNRASDGAAAAGVAGGTSCDGASADCGGSSTGCGGSSGCGGAGGCGGGGGS